MRHFPMLYYFYPVWKIFGKGYVHKCTLIAGFVNIGIVKATLERRK